LHVIRSILTKFRNQSHFIIINRLFISIDFNNIYRDLLRFY
uniref:Transposase n=1 Tax=Brugia timori TaxID=42155 RepID=A0A0R3R4Z6_9BILA